MIGKYIGQSGQGQKVRTRCESYRKGVKGAEKGIEKVWNERKRYEPTRKGVKGTENIRNRLDMYRRVVQGTENV